MINNNFKFDVVFLVAWILGFSESAEITRFQKQELLSVGQVISSEVVSGTGTCVNKCALLGACNGALFDPETLVCLLMADYDAVVDAYYTDGNFYAKRVRYVSNFVLCLCARERTLACVRACLLARCVCVQAVSVFTEYYKS